MASSRTLINGTGYDIKKGRTLINGTGYDIKKGRTLIGGTGYDISFTTPLGELLAGASVFTNYNNARREFIVLHQGNPDSSIYDDSCNGTWLCIKDIYDKRYYNNAQGIGNHYADSAINYDLNNTYLNLFDAAMQSMIKQVKIPYRTNGYKHVGEEMHGANGLLTKLFLLSANEINWTQGEASSDGDTSMLEDLPTDGACLSYFSGCAYSDQKRVSLLDGVDTSWGLRTPVIDNDDGDKYAYTVNTSGSPSYWTTTIRDFEGIRFAFILPPDTQIDDSFNIVVP